MAKGIKTGGGTRKGKPNKFTAEKREIAAAWLSDKLELERWEHFTNSEDERIQWEAFKLAKMYKSGQPKAVEKHEHTVKVELSLGDADAIIGSYFIAASGGQNQISESDTSQAQEQDKHILPS